jgi:hypothetical protein
MFSKGEDQRTVELGPDQDRHDLRQYDLWRRLFKHRHTKQRHQATQLVTLRETEQAVRRRQCAS